MVVADRQLKRYHVSNDDTPLDSRIEAGAYAMIPDLLPEWERMRTNLVTRPGRNLGN